jgi:hypothetical protein
MQIFNLLISTVLFNGKGLNGPIANSFYLFNLMSVKEREALKSKYLFQRCYNSFF